MQLVRSHGGESFLGRDNNPAGQEDFSLAVSRDFLSTRIKVYFHWAAVMRDKRNARKMPKKAFVKNSLASSPQGYCLFVRGGFYVNHFNVMGGLHSASVNKSLFHHKATAPLSGVSSMSITST